MRPLFGPTAVAVVALLIAGGGCAHHVTVQSNVEDAAVRVDGVPVGTVKEGATFAESAGFFRSYDVEVTAPGYHTERRHIVPRETDPWRGVPAMCLLIGSCSAASCLGPTAGLAALLVSDDVDASTFFWGVSGASVALFAGSAAIAAYGIDVLPDTIVVELEADETAMLH